MRRAVSVPRARASKGNSCVSFFFSFFLDVLVLLVFERTCLSGSPENVPTRFISLLCFSFVFLCRTAKFAVSRKQPKKYDETTQKV